MAHLFLDGANSGASRYPGGHIKTWEPLYLLTVVASLSPACGAVGDPGLCGRQGEAILCILIAFLISQNAALASICRTSSVNHPGADRKVLVVEQPRGGRVRLDQTFTGASGCSCLLTAGSTPESTSHLILFLDTDLMRTPDSWAGEAVSGGSSCGTVRVRIHTRPPWFV